MSNNNNNNHHYHTSAPELLLLSAIPGHPDDLHITTGANIHIINVTALMGLFSQDYLIEYFHDGQLRKNHIPGYREWMKPASHWLLIIVIAALPTAQRMVKQAVAGSTNPKLKEQ